MSDGTKIEWTEATWNPITGCSVISPGCTNCYAMKLAGTRLRNHESRAGLTQDSKAGPVWTGEVRLNEQWLDQPLRWKRPRKIFVCAHGDLFHENVPDEWIDRVFAVMALSPQHTFQVLTKRSSRMREYVSAFSPFFDKRARVFHRRTSFDASPACGPAVPAYVTRGGVAPRFRPKGSPLFHYTEGWPLRNVWLGVSVEDQQRANERIPDLLATPAAMRWVSCEPLLGPVHPTHLSIGHSGELDALTGRWRSWPLEQIHGQTVLHQLGDTPKLDWIVAGGESGPGARPMHPDWVRRLRDQCVSAGVPYFFKQWGDWAEPDDSTPDGAKVADLMPDGKRVVHANALTAAMVHIGKRRAGRTLDGIIHADLPSPVR